MGERIPFETYYDHILQLNPAEQQLQAELIPQLPSTIIDSHVHASAVDHYDPEAMNDRVYNHMMSTFPVTDIGTSALIDEKLMPDIEVRKIRFAHAYAGIDHFGVTEYLLENTSTKDVVAAFGLSETPEQIEHTIEKVRDPNVAGLKMYYLATGHAKSDLYDYFPKAILEVAQEEGKPIILHLPHSLYNSHEEVHDIATEFPGLDIVLAHMGVAHIPRENLGSILESFAQYPNVYADTSQVHDAELISAGITHLGVDRLLYGSDEPLNLLRAVIYDNPTLGPRILTDYPYHWVDQEEYREHIESITTPFIHSEWQQLQAIFEGMRRAGVVGNSHSEEVKSQIFYENAARVFHI